MEPRINSVVAIKLINELSVDKNKLSKDKTDQPILKTALSILKTSRFPSFDSKVNQLNMLLIDLVESKKEVESLGNNSFREISKMADSTTSQEELISNVDQLIFKINKLMLVEIEISKLQKMNASQKKQIKQFLSFARSFTASDSLEVSKDTQHDLEKLRILLENAPPPVTAALDAALAKAGPKLFSDRPSLTEYVSIIETLARLPEGEIAQAAEHASKTFTHRMNLDEKISIIKDFSRKYDPIVRSIILINEFIEGKINLNVSIKQLKILSRDLNFSKAKIKSLDNKQFEGKSSSAQSIISQNDLIIKGDQAIEKINKLIERKINEGKIIEEKLKTPEFSKILSGLDESQKAQLKEILINTPSLIEHLPNIFGGMFDPQKIATLNIMLRIPQDTLAAIAKFAPKLFLDKLMMMERIRVMEAFVKVTPETIAAMGVLVPKLGFNYPGFSEAIADSLEVLLSSEEEIIVALAQHASDLLIYEMTMEQKAELINRLVKTNPQTIADITKYAHEISKRSHNMDIAEEILLALAAVNPQKASAVAEQVSKLINDEMDISLVCKLINDFDQLPLGRISSVAQLMKDMDIKNTDNVEFHMDNIIIALTVLPEVSLNTVAAVVKHVPKLIDKTMNDDEKRQFISALGAAHPDVIGKLAEHVALLSAGMGINYKFFLLKALASFPKDEIQWDNENLLEWLVTPVLTRPGNYSGEAARNVAEFTINQRYHLQLHNEDDPLLYQAIAIGALTGSQEVNENPFQLFIKLKKLASEPSNFQPPVRKIENVKVAINMESLKQMSQSSVITREELPKNATIENWYKLLNPFFNKKQKEAEAYLENIDTNWAQLEAPIIHHDRQLENYLKISEGPVSEPEAKWRAVLSHILSKSDKLKDRAIFTEQEEVLIGTLRTIQNCDVGIDGGISDVYNLLPSEFKYKAKLSLPKTNEEMEEARKLNNALKCIEQAISGKASYQDQIQALTNFKKGNSSKDFFSLLEDEKFWNHPIINEELDYGTYLLNETGAEKLLEISAERKGKEMVTQILHQLAERPFTSDEKVAKELIGSDDIGGQGVHQLRYLKNVIGALVGAGEGVIFDLHIGAIFQQLLLTDRDRMLEVYFKDVNAEVMVNEVVKKINENFEKNKEILVPILKDEAAFWDIKDGKQAGLSKKGAIDLIKRAGYFTEV